MDFYDFFQNLKLSHIDTKTNNLGNKVQDAKDAIRNLEEKINNLSMVTLALSEIMMEDGIPKERIISKIKEIDLRDGYRNNELKPTLNNCPTCNRVQSTKRTKCLYCGTPIARETII